MHSKEVYYPSNHKKIETITRSGFPSDKRGEVKKGIKSLNKKGFIILVKPGSIALDKKLHSEIEKLVKS